MDHKKVLKRAWSLLWAYKALWIFGLILAVVAGSSSPGSNSGYRYNDGNQGNGSGTNWQPDEFLRNLREQFGQAGDDLSRFLEDTVLPNLPAWAIGLAIGFGVFVLIAWVVTAFLLYISETAMIRMVDDYEATGVKATVGKGFRLGWSRKAWRMFLIDLVIGIPAALAAILLLGLALSPLLLWMTENETLGILGTITAVGLFFVWLLLGFVVSIALALLKPFFRRACAMEDTGVTASIKRGYAIVRSHLKDAILMGLILFGISLVFGIITLIAGLIFGALGLLTGGLLGVGIGLLTAIGAQGAAPWVVGALFGGIVLGIVVGLPLWFLRGLYLTYVSNTWTLTYRELLALEATREDAVIEPAQPEVPAAA